MTSVIDKLRIMAENAYHAYISSCQRDECLGWRIKVDTRKFGEDELKAHEAAAENLGRYRTLIEVINFLEESTRNGDADELQAVNAALRADQEPLGEEFEAVWDANRDRLYEP